MNPDPHDTRKAAIEDEMISRSEDSELDRLRSQLATKDARIVELEASCATMRQALGLCNIALCNIPEEWQVNPRQIDQALGAIKSLSPNCGKHLLDRLKEAGWLLKNSRSQRRCYEGNREWFERCDAWLKGGGL